jgi:diaminohydroxyphosphoribosylaminopyrimidine deaminase/5-amino-6-(5-phosphoribosylamino)uracil reductase
VAATDPNPRVAGGGLRQLEAAGLLVTVGVLEREARELNRGFFARMSRGTPWVTVKVGASIDGRTALASGESKWITSEAARADVQRLRARASAVLTGIGTVLADDPSLIVRDPQLAMHGRQPLRVVFDTAGRINRECRLLNDGHQTLILAASTARAVDHDAAHVNVELLPVRQGRLDLQAALARLARLECNEVLVEAGPRLAGAFVAGGHVDEIVAYLAATILGDSSRPMFTLPEPLQSLAARQSYAFYDVRQVGADLRLALRPKGN